MRIIFDPDPRKTEEIFTSEDRKRFFSAHEVIAYEGGDREAFYKAHLPDAGVVISQQALDSEAIASAKALRCIVNVEGNFLPNIDYEACFVRGIPVIAISPVFAEPVAEMAIGMALCLARNIHGAHADFVAGHELYGLEGNQEAELLSGADVGFIGFGDLGRAIHKLLPGFAPRVRVFDPWLPGGHLRRLGVEPASLDEVLAKSRFVFVVAAITTENRYLLDRTKLDLMQDGAMLLLLARASLVDFEALAEVARARRLRIATDVFPGEPVASDDPIRGVPNILFSAHRAGALDSALTEIGRRVLEDLDQVSQGLPPVSCKRAERETVMRMRSKPVEVT